MSSADRGPFSALLLSPESRAGEPSAILWAAGVGSLHVVSDERTAVAALHDRPVDLIICDGDTSWTESLSVARRVRGMPHETRCLVPIVVLASDAPVQKVVAARNVGVHRVIDRSMPACRVAEEIRDLLQHPRSFIRDGGYFGPARASVRAAAGSDLEGYRSHD